MHVTESERHVPISRHQATTRSREQYSPGHTGQAEFAMPGTPVRDPRLPPPVTEEKVTAEVRVRDHNSGRVGVQSRHNDWWCASPLALTQPLPEGEGPASE